MQESATRVGEEESSGFQKPLATTWLLIKYFQQVSVAPVFCYRFSVSPVR